MSIEKLITDLAKKQSDEVVAAEEQLPDSCGRCSNLVTTVTPIGSTVLTCELERAGTGGRGRAKAKWVAEALRDKNPDSRSGALALSFRAILGLADDECPITERITSELVPAGGEDLIDLTPPSPLVTAGELRQRLDF